VVGITYEAESQAVFVLFAGKEVKDRQRSETMTQQIRTAAFILLSISMAVPAMAQIPGADTYKAKCAMCHGADGLATTPTAKNFKVLSFKDPEMLKASDAQFIASTTNGKNKMPAYSAKLTDEQIKDVIGYIRTLQK
jgi:mono/diheme cytochrome c family protein